MREARLPQTLYIVTRTITPYVRKQYADTPSELSPGNKRSCQAGVLELCFLLPYEVGKFSFFMI